ncbi:unnamed protein product [Paramecium primaurelia]|uniref:Spindle assembly abnormal protein 6 N-terminal domain-containing protein n=1 Tax=Paramecium primaurelia TaxID=5886 RepID=A0A8S1MBB4_PARPR|nr:unnamed protein product [Paramecium primaurelia]
MLKNTPSKEILNYQETQEETDSGGYTLIYEQELVSQILVEDGDQQQRQETLNVRVLIFGNDQRLERMKNELSCENDLFFHFIHDINEKHFKKSKMNSNQLHLLSIILPFVQSVSTKLIKTPINIELCQELLKRAMLLLKQYKKLNTKMSNQFNSNFLFA